MRIVRSRGDVPDPVQGLQLLPSQFVEMIPHLLTMVALAGLAGHATERVTLGKAEAAT